MTSGQRAATSQPGPPPHHYSLGMLSQDLVASLWPSERVVVGLRVCKWVRQAVSKAPSCLLRIKTWNQVRPGCTLQSPLLPWRGSGIDLEVRPLFGPLIVEMHQLSCCLCALGPRIGRLSIDRCTINPGCLSQPLACLPNLTTLSISATNIGNDGAREIAVGLHCTGLTRLDLASCNIGNDGVLCLTTALAELPAPLTHLCLSGNTFWASSALLLLPSACLSNLVTLDLSRTAEQVMSDRTRTYISDAERSGFADSVAILLPRCPSLTRLDLSCRYVLEAGARHLARGLSLLPSPSVLRVLSLAGSAWDSDEVALLSSRLASLPSLTSLSLSGQPPLDDAGLRGLASACTRLQTLDLAGVLPPCGGEVALALSAPESGFGAGLATLQLTACGLRPDVCSAILRRAGAWGRLRRVNLAENGLGAEGTAAVGMALPACVVSLGINGNGVGEQGGRALGRALGNKRALKDLHVRCNGMGAEGLIALIEGMAEVELARLVAGGNKATKGGRRRVEQAAEKAWAWCAVSLA